MVTFSPLMIAAVISARTGGQRTSDYIHALFQRVTSDSPRLGFCLFIVAVACGTFLYFSKNLFGKVLTFLAMFGAFFWAWLGYNEFGNPSNRVSLLGVTSTINSLDDLTKPAAYLPLGVAAVIAVFFGYRRHTGFAAYLSLFVVGTGAIILHDIWIALHG